MVLDEVAMKSAQRRRYDRGVAKLEHEIMIDYDKHYAAEHWCREQFGKRWEVFGYREGLWACFWGGRNDHRRYRFCFAESEDAVFFALKWQ
jgi:hypothetical protein